MTDLPCLSTILAAGQVPPLFSLFAVMLLGVVVVSLLLLRMRFSLLVGYFFCGVVIANAGIVEMLGGAASHDAVREMAEFGVMLLMFVLGMEFSVRELRFLRRFALVGGGLQMGICILVVLIIARVAGLSWPAAIVLGVALAMSSTAVSLKAFQDMEFSGSPGARFALGVAIFQDLFIVTFLVFLPILLEADVNEQGLVRQVGGLFVRGGAFMLLSWGCARWLIPRLLRAVVRTRSRELFTLTVVGCCVGLAWAASLLHLSLVLGAFVAGLAVSESVYKHRILADITPVKNIFLTLFFVSVGLFIDLRVAAENWRAILLITLLLVITKAVFVSGIAWFLGLVNRAALLGGLALCSAGEFSLMLLQMSADAALWEPWLQQSLMAAVAISMGLVPGLMRLADPITGWMGNRGWGRRYTRGDKLDQASVRSRVERLSGHAIICGYGPVGRALNRALLGEGVPTLIVEMNADTVHQLMAEGQPALFADAAHGETWALTRLEEAVMVAFTFADAAAAAAGMNRAREINPEVAVLARVRFASDRARMERLGANIVIHDEGEAARAVIDSGLRITARKAAVETPADS